MLRRFVVTMILLSCFAAPGWSQSPSTPPTAPAPGNPVAKKPAPKAKAAAKPATVVDSGPCKIGVISAIGDKFVLEHIGLTVFGNEFTDAPIESWGLDELVVARARAAAGGQSVRRITYARGAFDPYYNPPRELFRDAKNDLVNVVRQVAANANCERYLVVVRSSGQVPNTNQSANGVGLVTNGPRGLSSTLSCLPSLALPCSTARPSQNMMTRSVSRGDSRNISRISGEPNFLSRSRTLKFLRRQRPLLSTADCEKAFAL